MKKSKVGIIGTGTISDIYCKNLTQSFENTELFSCADINADAARAKATKWNIPNVFTTDKLIGCPDIDIVINLTPPQYHYEICRKALLAGKHVYTEKPLSLTLADGMELCRIADEKGLMIGSAPETNYGAGISTAKEAIDSGKIGEILYADARFHWHGDECWHPNPAFLYKKGAGPLFDRGPYFINTLVYLLGSVTELFAMTQTGFPVREILTEPHRNEIIQVETPTHVEGIMRFASGASATAVFSFDMKSPKQSVVEIHGTKGSIRLSSPVFFGGPTMICHSADSTYTELPLVNDFIADMRGFAVSDMAKCIAEKRRNNIGDAHRACHVLDIMEGFLRSGESDKVYRTETSVCRIGNISNTEGK